MATSSNPALLPGGNLVISGLGPNATLNGTPNAGQAGAPIITVTVADTGVSVSTSFQVTIAPVIVTLKFTRASVLPKGGGFQLNYEGAQHTTYTVEASTNLKTWTTLGAGAEVSPGNYQLVDTNTAAFPHRFYRFGIVTQIQPINLTPSVTAKGNFILTFFGTASSYTVQGSTNLLRWSALGPGNPIGSNNWEFIGSYQLLPYHFYRVSSP
jgi:hypothetical protein